MLEYLKLAAQIARSHNEPKKNFLMACVGIRQDGAMVSARNGSIISSPQKNYRIVPEAHCEARTLRKLGKGGILFVARVLKKDGALAMAAPCLGCRLLIRAARVPKVIYSVNELQFGIWSVPNDYDRVFYF